MKKNYLLLMLVLAGFVARAQNASTYVFGQSTGSYTQVGAGATQLTAVNADTYISPAQGIGFTFVYEGVSYTQFAMSSNGFITFNVTSPSALTTNDFTSANTATRPIIAPLWDDLDGNATGGSYAGYEVTGTAPNRVLTVEWRNWEWRYNSTSPVISFQVKLYETTNIIQFVYRQESGSVNSGTASIGIGSATGSGNGSYLNVTDVTTPAVSSTNSVTTINTKPATGQIFTFSPPGPCVAPTAQATSLVLTPSASAVNATFTAASPVADKYLVVRTPGSTALNTNPVNGTTYASNGTLGNGTVVSYNSAASFSDINLSSNTPYTYTIFTANDACTGGPVYNTTNPLTGNTATLTAMAYTWIATSGSADATIPASWNPARNVPDVTDTLYFTQGGTSTINNINTTTVAKLVVANNTTIIAEAGANATVSIGSSLSIASGSTLEIGGINNLTLNYVSGNNPTGDIAGTLTLNGSGTTNFNTANSVTNVSGSINVASGTSSVSGSATTLFMNAGSNYNHNRNGGSSPAATYAPTSNFNVLGIVGTGLTPPSKVGNLTWDCPSQTISAYSWGSSVDTIRGNFNVINTGTGSFQLGAGSGTITTVMGDFNQTDGTMIITASTNLLRVVGTTQLTGGTLNVSSSSGTGTLIATGNLNQGTGHTLTETGSGTAVINFNGTTAQTAAFNGILTNSIGYAINNAAGVVLSGIPSVNSGAGVTITNGSFSGIPFSYASSSNTLTYNGAVAQTTSDFEFPGTAGPTALTINNTSAAGVTLHSARTLTSGFTLTAGKLNTTTTNLLTLASTITSTPAGSATAYVNGPLAIEVNTTANATRNWAVGDANGGRPIQLAAFHTGGSPTTFVGESILGNAGGSGLTTMNTTRYFRLTNISAIQSTTTPTIRLSYGNDDVFGLSSTAVIGQSTTSNGVYTDLGQSANAATTITSGTVTPVSSAGGDYFIIGNTGVLKTWDGGASTSNWGDAANWNPNGVPTSTEDVTIGGNATVNLNVNGTVRSLTVATGSTLNINANTLTADTLVANNGTLNLGGGTIDIGPAGGGNKTYLNGTGAVANLTSGNLNVNGKVLISGGVFNQSGGTITIDGNSGTAATSVPQGSHLFAFTVTSGPASTFSGGTIILVDPPHSSVATGSSTATRSIHVGSNPNTVSFTGTHTFQIGDGISTTSGNADGFIMETYASSRVVINNVVINGGNAGNRHATASVNNSSVWGFLTRNITINANSELRTGPAAASSNVFHVAENIVNNGTMTVMASTMLLGSNTDVPLTVTTPQTISGTGVFQNNTTGSTANFRSITLNNAGGVTFNTGADVSYSGTLTFTLGNMFMGTQTMIQIAGAGVSGSGATTGWVVGKFQKAAGTGGINHTYPIGDATTYTPLVISGAAGSVTTAGDIVAGTTTGSHPNIGTSTIQPSNSVNRYFTITALNGITFAANALNVTLNWASSDLDPNATTATFIVGKYDGSTWTYPTVASPTATSIQATGISSFSDFIIGSTSPLAIKLVNISAKNAGATNHVNWQTASEETGDVFELERSTDRNEFSKIASVNAKGAAAAYTYVDQTPAKGINYYRLKMINSNGRFEYSKIVQAIVSGKDAFIVRAYPNPVVDNKLTVEVTGTIAKNAVITVTDVTGKIVRTVNVTNNKTDIDMSSATSGIYFVKYMDAEQSHTIKVTK